MSTSPDPSLHEPEHPAVLPEAALPEQGGFEPAPTQEVPEVLPPPAPIDAAPHTESYFDAYARSLPPPPRFPNIIDVLLMAILFGFGWLASGAVAAKALQLHLFGVRTERQAMNDIHYTLGSQAVWYLVALAAWMVVFPRIWHTGFFRGIEWRAAAALRLRWQLFSAAFACFILAIVDGVLLPGPKEAPIDQVFRMPGGAWLLFAFGITLAPLIEEMIYRGFLLPAFCTLWDFTAERIQERPAPWPDENGKAKWSLGAMVFGAVTVSVPFALMHGYQTSYSMGTFVLLFFVSVALCWIRLSTRSLAACTVVHACYNLMLFALMIWGTGGFKHLDNM
jgi:membrane protease YdiL (CAAX protease family)